MNRSNILNIPSKRFQRLNSNSTSLKKGRSSVFTIPSNKSTVLSPAITKLNNLFNKKPLRYAMYLRGFYMKYKVLINDGRTYQYRNGLPQLVYRQDE